MIVIHHTSLSYFTLFYVASFLTCFIILIAEGRLRSLPLFPWLLVVATGFVFFVIGSKLITYSLEDWRNVLRYQNPDHPTGSVMVGGLLLSIPAILGAKRFLNLTTSALDAYAFVLPVGMLIQRIGCFITGCCYGKVTDSFGIRYGFDTHPYNEQAAVGVIPADAIHSLPLHAVQLYESAGCLVAIALLLWFRKKLTCGGSLFYASGLSYYVVRFVTEFFRSPRAYAIEIDTRLGLTYIQWLMLFLIVGSIIVLFYKERNPRVTATNKDRPVNIRMVVYFVVLAIIFLFASRYLSPAETFVVYIVLFTTGGYLLLLIFNAITVPRLRLTSLCLLLLSLVLMSQTYPEAAESDSIRISYNTISISWGPRSWTFKAMKVVQGKQTTDQAIFKHNIRSADWDSHAPSKRRKQTASLGVCQHSTANLKKRWTSEMECTLLLPPAFKAGQ